MRRHGPLLPRRLSPPCHRVTSHVSPTARATHTTLVAVALHVLTDIPSVAYDSGKRATEMGRKWAMGRTEFICDPSVINKTKKQNFPGFSRGLFVCSVHVFFYCPFFFFLYFFRGVHLFTACFLLLQFLFSWSFYFCCFILKLFKIFIVESPLIKTIEITRMSSSASLRKGSHWII